MRRSLIPVAVLAALAFFGGLGRGAIGDNDEAFYAEAAREMVERGDWVTPSFNYEPRFQKPALYYWLTAALFTVVGTSELAARFWSAAAALGLVLVTASCGRRWYDESVGMLAGAIAATSVGYFALARLALPDLPLALSVTTTIWATLVAAMERERNPRKWLLCAALAAALGFLVKGPLALVLPALVITPVLLLERRSYNIQLSDVVLAAGLFVLIASPWYLVMWIRHGPDYLAGFFVGDNFERFATTRFNDPRPWWFYGPIIAGGLLPWTPLALVWGTPLRQFVLRRADIGAIEVRLLLWVLLPLAFFTLSIGKQPRYVLPLLPPLAILLAASILWRTSDWRSLDGARRQQRPTSAITVGCVFGGLILMGLGALLFRAQPLFVDVPTTNTVVVAAIAVLAGATVILTSVTMAWRSAPGVLSLATAITFAVLPYGVYARARDSAVVRMAASVRTAAGAGEPIGTYQVFVRNLVFYSGLQQTDLIHEQHLRDWLATHPRALVVMPSPEMRRLTQAGWSVEQLAEYRYFNEGGLKPRMLLWPDPSTDVTTVVLVRIDGVPRS